MQTGLTRRFCSPRRSSLRCLGWPLAVLIVALCVSCARQATDTPPVGTAETAETVEAAAEHRRWQEERLADLRAEDGWLAVVGLEWLEPGEQTLGWSDDVDLQLPEPPEDAPPVVARVLVEEGDDGPRASVRPVCDRCRVEWPEGDGDHAEEVTENRGDGEDSGDWFPFSPSGGATPVLRAGSFEIHVLERGDRLALRVRNRESPRREALAEIPTWPHDPAWILTGRFEPAGDVRDLAIDNSTDYDYPQQSVGRFVFERDGQEFAMELLGTDPAEPQLLMVADATGGEATYGGGRYLYVDVTDRDHVVADFNRLYNPPCVFTSWATCPLPPPSNRLPFAVEAGEKLPVFVGDG